MRLEECPAGDRNPEPPQDYFKTREEGGKDFWKILQNV